MSKKYTLLTFKGICMNFLLELKFFILSHPVTSKQPREIVQIHMHHPVSENHASGNLVMRGPGVDLKANVCYPLCPTGD